MADYISKETLQAKLNRKKAGPANKRYTEGWNDAVLMVKSMIHGEKAADVAPVVRCKDCKHHYDCGVHFCNRLGMDCPDDSDFFCSYGEPKNGGASDVRIAD